MRYGSLINTGLIFIVIIILIIVIINTKGQAALDEQRQERTSQTHIKDDKNLDCNEDVLDEEEILEKDNDEDDYSWLIPQADYEIFTEEEKKQIEADTLKAASDIWELYKDITIDESLPSYSSGIVDFTKQQRFSVLAALGELGVIATTDDANTQNGETETYRQETVYNSPYPPFLEVTDYNYNANGTITLYADGVWPDYNSDYAFSSEIIVKPFDDGTFQILSNDVTEQELRLPPVAYIDMKGDPKSGGEP